MREQCAEAPLPQETQVKIVKGWHVQQNPFSEQWKSLVQHKRPLLMELACFPDSRLCNEVERRFGKGSAIRCSIWNGGDLETPEGISHAKRMLDIFRPVHLWIACDCAPFCPLQRLNQRTPEQQVRLQEKQNKARVQYRGAMEVAQHAQSLNTQIHWELSERCEAWSLPEMTEFLSQHGLEKVTCHGCTVGLRTRDGKLALCKGWSIASKDSHLLRHMNLRCQRNHRKGKCEGGQTTHTARYTEPFARRVIDCLTMNETWSRIVEELQKKMHYQETAYPVEAADSDAEMQEVGETPEEKQEREEIRKKIQQIHQSTGHGSLKALVEALEKRGSTPKVLEEARKFRCTICEARKRMDPRRFATLETVPQKGERIQADIATWVHPHSGDKHHVMVIIDEGSRFRMARWVSTGKGQPTTWVMMKKVLEENWFSLFGYPQTLRVDPAGPWKNTEAEEYALEKNFELVPIPAEAHYQIGIVEGAIKSLKGVLDKLAESFSHLSMEELVSRATWTSNNMDSVRGFTPIQRIMGKAPDDAGRFFKSDNQIPICRDMLQDGGFTNDVEMRLEAEKAFLEEQALRRTERALRMGRRRAEVYLPGDLVYYWRNQVPLKEKTTQRTGKFIGPARVLATETRRENTGELRPGHIVWLHRNGRLIKTVPEQLRKASPYEQQVESLAGPIELPWTITALATHQDRATYQDVTKEIPSDAQWEEATEEHEDPTETVPTRRMRHKGFSPMEIEPARGFKRDAEQPSGSGDQRRPKEPRADYSTEAGAELFYAKEENCLAMEIEWEIPTSRRGIKKFFENPETFVATQLKKRQVEVHERTLTPSEAQQFQKAKEIEVRNFVKSGCFEIARERGFEESKTLGMRWLLTWKYGDEYPGGRKAKARGVILGYQDPSYASRPTSAPTPTRSGRQLFWQYCSWKRFRISKGDISGAFLQGKPLEEELWCRPVREISEALGVPEATPLKMRKAAYGLVQAPLQWYHTIHESLVELGYSRLQVEPCCWIFRDKSGTVRSIVHSHVDDLMFGGSPECSIHKYLMDQLQQRFQWGSWEETKFVQCGIEVHQLEDFSIEISQTKYIDDLEEIYISRDRSRMPDAPVTEEERRKLRGALGSISWLCGQTCFLYSADVNFLITSIPVATVNELLKTNKLVRDIKKTRDTKYKIHAFLPDEELELACWTDAGWANRPNGTDSTEGIFVGMTSTKLRQGYEEKVTPIHWKSSKIERICRSPGCAETAAGLDGEDELSYLRIFWNEMKGHEVELREVDVSTLRTAGLLISDSRNVFDRITRATPTVKGAERRAALEALSLRQNLERSETSIHWVNGGAMLANPLTKPHEKGQFWLFLSLGQKWKIVYDEQFLSEKKRRKEGMTPL